MPGPSQAQKVLWVALPNLPPVLGTTVQPESEPTWSDLSSAVGFLGLRFSPM